MRAGGHGERVRIEVYPEAIAMPGHFHRHVEIYVMRMQPGHAFAREPRAVDGCLSKTGAR
jgi:hypothetical protein